VRAARKKVLNHVPLKVNPIILRIHRTIHRTVLLSLLDESNGNVLKL
jgi:hypothetical protein